MEYEQLRSCLVLIELLSVEICVGICGVNALELRTKGRPLTDLLRRLPIKTNTAHVSFQSICRSKKGTSYHRYLTSDDLFMDGELELHWYAKIYWISFVRLVGFTCTTFHLVLTNEGPL